MSTNPLACLRDSPVLADIFWELCEFGVLEGEIPDWFAVESGDPLQIVGKDACGGRFCLFPSSSDYSGRLVFIDSEGRAGMIASSLLEGIQMMIALPYWRDCLKFSGGGDIAEMLRAQTRAERDLQRRMPDIGAIRNELLEAFGLAPLAAPVESLHGAVVEGASLKVIATCDGSRFASLFNEYVVKENPV
jgi:hypothetical protein